MKPAATLSPVESRTEWFESWFDSEHYHRLYAARDDGEAAAFLDRLVERLQFAPGANVLDLACGAGRHSAHLGAKGFSVTGIDLSPHSIVRARARRAPNTRFLRRDMREPFGVSAFDCVLSLFTSLGYFEDPAENVTVLHNVATALVPGGTLVVDYMNTVHAERTLVAAERVEREDAVYHIVRSHDREAFVKRISIEEHGTRTPLEFVERVAKLTLEDFRFLFALCGMEIEHTFGDYALDAFDPETSPRLILVARKTAGRSYLRERFFRMRLNVSGVIPR